MRVQLFLIVFIDILVLSSCRWTHPHEAEQVEKSPEYPVDDVKIKYIGPGNGLDIRDPIFLQKIVISPRHHNVW